MGVHVHVHVCVRVCVCVCVCVYAPCCPFLTGFLRMRKSLPCPKVSEAIVLFSPYLRNTVTD